MSLNMRYDEAVADLFANGAEMVVVVNRPDSFHVRGVILDGLRELADESNLERAAGVVSEETLGRYLMLSAISGAVTGS
jgi:hypothetical protein